MVIFEERCETKVAFVLIGSHADSQGGGLPDG